MIDTAVEDPERVARGLVRLAQSHRQRDHRDGMDAPAGAKFAARIRMFDRVRPLPWPSQTCRTITTTGTPCSARRLTAWPRCREGRLSEADGGVTPCGGRFFLRFGAHYVA
jgi:hypothetical protein